VEGEQMKSMLIYFLLGAIVAVWTAINRERIPVEDDPSQEQKGVALLPAYIIIAIAWPVSVIVSVYSFVMSMFADDSRG